MKKIKAFFDNGRSSSKKEEEKERTAAAADSDYAAAVAKLPKLETLAVNNINIIDSLPLSGSKVAQIVSFFTVYRYCCCGCVYCKKGIIFFRCTGTGSV
jgi:hypothetical protein